MKTLGVFLMIAAQAAQAGVDVREIRSFREVVQTAQTLGQSRGVDRVLMAYDIDSTLLAMDQDLGSDYWFTWQAGLIRENDPRDRVATSLAGLFAAQLQLYTLSGMHPPEAEIPAQVGGLARQGFASFALTSRMTDFRDVTERHFRDAGLDFSGVAPRIGHRGTFRPIDPRRPEASGVTRTDLERAKISEVPAVSYDHGIYLSAGLHKGLTLKSFLHGAGRRFDAVVFVDDSKRHVEGMRAIFADDDSVEVVALRYGHEDERIQGFERGPKTAAIEGWRAFTAFVGQIFGRKHD